MRVDESSQKMGEKRRDYWRKKMIVGEVFQIDNVGKIDETNRENDNEMRDNNEPIPRVCLRTLS